MYKGHEGILHSLHLILSLLVLQRGDLCWTSLKLVEADIDFLLTTSILNRKERLWEFMKWSGKILWSFNKFSQLCLREMWGDQSGEFVCWYWGWKGRTSLPFNLTTRFQHSSVLFKTWTFCRLIAAIMFWILSISSLNF